MATYNAVVVELINPETGQPLTDPSGQPIRYYSPPGYQYAGLAPMPVEMAGWGRYTGSVDSLSQDCIPTPTPGSSDPVWVLSSLPSGVNGQYYSVDIYYNTAGAPASGKTITGIEWGSLPPWLAPSVSSGEGKISLRGTVPSGITSFSVPLILRQSDARSTPKTFTVSVSTVGIVAYYVYRAPTRRLTIYVGPDGDGNPTTALLESPASYPDRVTYNIGRLGTPTDISGTTYNFSIPYNGIVVGRYVGKINWLGQNRYYALDLIADASEQGVLTLYNEQPTPAPDTNWTQDGDGELIPFIIIEYAWTTTVDEYATHREFEFWVKLDTSDLVQLKIVRNGADRDYGTIMHGDFGDGFQNYQFAYEGAPGDLYTLYFRRSGLTSDFAIISLPALPSSGNVSRTRIFPVS